VTTPPAPRPAPPPDVRRTLAWRGWRAGLAEAEARGVPIVCLAEAPWSNGAQRLALVLEGDAETRALLEADVVPVLVDPIARPDVAAHLRWAATALTGTFGPPLLVVLTPLGAPFLAYCSLWPEGRPPYPSLGSLLRSVVGLGRDRRAAMEAEASGLRVRAPGGRWPGQGWASTAGRVDERFGGLHELPKHPHAPLLWRLLDEAGEPAVRAHLLRTLDGMRAGGVLDQLGGSFHRCARDERWVVPHFEKLVPPNAALAAVYARAAAVVDRPEFAATAHEAARFALAGLDEDAMVVASDTAYYTWTPPDFQAQLDPSLVQALGLHFAIARDDAPQVLFRALEPDAMGAYADESPTVLHERVRRGKARLALARGQRPPPARPGIEAPAWRAETLRWLFEAARHGVDLDGDRLVHHLTALLDGPFDPLLGYARPAAEGAKDTAPGDGGRAYWLEDQAAIAAACLAAGDAEPRAPATAARLADLVLGAYLDPATGTLSDAPLATEGSATSHDVVDHALSAAVPTMVEVLASHAAAASTGARDRERFGRAAEQIRQRHLRTGGRS
jgi:uncharacterized protein